jgi:hypothetical protein
VRAEHRLEAVAVPGAAASVLASGVAFLQPEEAVLDAMLAGWTAQQRSRLLSAGTVEQRELQVRRFVAFTNEYPWRWSPADVEQWSADMVSRGGWRTRRCVATRTRWRCFSGMRLIAVTAGIRRVSSDSVRIRCRCSMSGTPPRIAAMSRLGRATGR